MDSKYYIFTATGEILDDVADELAEAVQDFRTEFSYEKIKLKGPAQLNTAVLNKSGISYIVYTMVQTIHVEATNTQRQRMP
ncbi:MAG: hypothetical protein KAJ73_00470 [Zetaproteobacteria bacterium]|nr:hypothetical protein [Zetaproteobacteria bacterium]